MRADLKGVIEEAKRLESLAMTIYTLFAATFAGDGTVHSFWMSMARHEAAHVGALSLLAVLLEQGGEEVELNEAPDVIASAAAEIEALVAEAGTLSELERAFQIAVQLEGLELEDLVLDLIHILADPAARAQAEQMLLHDLSDLSLMVEKHCKDEATLARLDSMIEARVDSAKREPIVVRRA